MSILSAPWNVNANLLDSSTTQKLSDYISNSDILSFQELKWSGIVSPANKPSIREAQSQYDKPKAKLGYIATSRLKTKQEPLKWQYLPL